MRNRSDLSVTYWNVVRAKAMLTRTQATFTESVERFPSERVALRMDQTPSHLLLWCIPKVAAACIGQIYTSLMGPWRLSAEAVHQSAVVGPRFLGGRVLYGAGGERACGQLVDRYMQWQEQPRAVLPQLPLF